MKKFKKLSAIFLSALLLLSAVFIPATMTTASAADDPTTSLIYGQTASYSAYHSSGLMYDSSDHATMKTATDGNTSAYAQFYGGENEKLVWSFNGYARIDSFELWAHTNVLYDFSFNLYIADNSADLFKAESLVYTHTRDEANTNSGHYEGAVALPDGGDVYGAVVGMEITAMHETNKSVAMREFCLYGEAVDDPDGTFYTNKYMLSRNQNNLHAASLIAGKTPYKAVDTSGDTVGVSASYEPITSLTDGSYVSVFTTKTDINTGTYGESYFLTYQLDDLSKITGASVYNGVNNVAYKWDWELYVGTDPSTLYDGTAVASGCSFDDTGDGWNFGSQVLLSNNNIATGNYVGFKITPNNTASDGTARIFELQVFGEANQSGAAMRWAETTDASSDSLLYGRELETAYVDTSAAGAAFDNANITKTYTYLSNGARITDGTVSTAHADVQNGKNGKLIWALDKTTDIESFLLYNNKSSVYLTSYEVYASDKLETLFDLDNKIYEYKFERDPDTTYPLEQYCKAGGQYVDFYGDAVKSANYVAVWLRDGGIGGSTNTGIRIAEIAFFGTETENAKSNPRIYTQQRGADTAYDVWATKMGDESFTYENNLLNAGSFSAKDTEGNTVSLDASNVAKLTNGTTNAEEFYGAYQNYELTYFLGAPTAITGLMINRNNNNNYQGAEYSEGYKVYLGYDQATLYNEENLILDLSDATATPRLVGVAAKFTDTSKKGIFLGIKVVDSTYADGNVRIAEVAAWGIQDELGYTISPSIGAMASADSAKANETDVNLLAGLKAETGYYGSTNSTTGLYCVDGITDGIANRHYDFNYTPYSGAVSSELLYDLGYVSTVNEFALWMTCAGRQYSYEVYMGEDYDTMFETPVAVWDYTISPDSLGQKFSFDEGKQVRYIAVRLSTTRVSGDSYRVSEIAAFGTLGGEDADFVQLNGAEISEDGKNISYNATYYFPRGIKTETVTDIGTIVYPTTALANSGLDLTLENVETLGASKASAAVDEAMDIVNGYDEEGYTAIRADSVFAGADTVGATTKLTARAYVTLSDGTTYYSAPYSYSVTQIKRLMAKKYKSVFENDTDYITNKGYNDAIDTVWEDAKTSVNDVDTKKSAMVTAAAGWLNDIISEYGLEAEWLNNGIVTMGDTSRISAVIRKLMRGEDVTVVGLGGSITEGYFAGGQEKAQSARVADFLNAAFPDQVTYVSAGISATGAVVGAYRLNQDVLAYDPDLVIVEYAVNDSNRVQEAMAAYESIIRNLLTEDVAVLALQNVTYSSNSMTAAGSGQSHENVGLVYGIPQANAHSAFFGTSIYSKGGDDYYFGTDDGTHPNEKGHAASGALMANLIYNIMLDIENQPTESAMIPTSPIQESGDYITPNADTYSAQEIEAGNTPVAITGATYAETGITRGTDAIIGANPKGFTGGVKTNNTYDTYTVASGETAIIAVNNVTDLFLLVGQNTSGSSAVEYTVTDTSGNVLSEGTFSAYYSGSLTTDKSRTINNDGRLYHGDATNVLVNVTAVEGELVIAGVLACVADGWTTPIRTEAPIMTYDLEQYTAPVWEGNTVYHESVLFIKNEDGTVTAPALLYTPERILSVASADLGTTYTLGKDFTIEGNRIVLTDDTTIPVMPYESYISGGSVINTTTVMNYQLSVSYTHADAWALSTPTAQLANMPNLKAKLEAGEAVNMLFCGDSITVGYEGSGFHEVAPYMPGWVDMVEASLEAKYSSEITVNNVAVGGTTTGHGLTQHILNVTADTDVVFIAYGMNMSDNTANYDDHIRQMIDHARGVNADVEIVLVSSMTANEHESVKPGNVLDAQEDVLDAIAVDYTGVAVAPVNTIFENAQTIKRYLDITGNFVNHPNDFGIRLYAQTVLAVLS